VGIIVKVNQLIYNVDELTQGGKMYKEHRITVVIPACNEEKYIASIVRLLPE